MKINKKKIFIKNALHLQHPVLIDVYRYDVCSMKLVCLLIILDIYNLIVDRKPNTNKFSLLQRLEYHTPMSFEQALAMGRTGVLPSPVINGFKPKGGLSGLPTGRHSDSDEEDWC